MSYHRRRSRWVSNQLYELQRSVARRQQFIREMTEAAPPSRPAPRPATIASGEPNAEIIPIAPHLADQPEAA